jgi:GNAT superfamily N-acetyltransferase
VELRAATVEDIPELARLRWQLYLESSEAFEETFPAYLGRFSAFATDALTSDRWHVWVAEDEPRLAGAMWLFSVPRIPQPDRGAPAPLAYLTNVYVERRHRDRGLGSQMLDEVKAWCAREGYSLVMVWPSDRSYPFYERAGFVRHPDPLVLDLGGDWRAPHG